MANFSVPSSPVLNTLKLENFLGVDFTTEITDVNLNRSPDALNMINEDGYLEKRKGTKTLINLGAKINGIWNMDTSNGEVLIIHVGTELYEISSDFKVKVKIKTGLNNKKSSGLVFKSKLVIFDGLRALVYAKFDSSYEVKYLDEIGYIPTTVISRLPAGGGTTYEEVNMIQPKRINSFLGDASSFNYQLDCENIDKDEVIVQVLNSNADYTVLKENTHFTVDRTKGIVKFKTQPGESPVEGRDNITIRFSKKDSEYIDQINKCTIFTTFGYNGNNNRIFITGNPKYPNIDWHSAIDDPTYFPDVNYTAIGMETSPIIAYARVNDGRLAILKDVTDTDCTVYYRTSAMFSGKEVFPLQSGVKGIGCICSNASAVVQNESFFLSNQGVFSISSSSNNDQNYFNLRSYYINGKLLYEENLKEAIGIEFNGKYYLAINGNVYVCDTRYKTYEKDSKTSGYQYEWYFLNNIPAIVWFVWNNELYFGTKEGKICKFKNKTDVDVYKDDGNNVKSYWRTPMLYFNNLINSKTIKKIILSHNPKINSEIEMYYYLKKGQKEIISKSFNIKGNTFPKVLQIKKKAKKFMFVQLELLSNNPVNMSFIQIIIQYMIGGKYRGE